MLYKEYKLPINSFIGGWFIDSLICKKLIEFFNNNKKLAHKGRAYACDKEAGDETSVKDSLDLSIPPEAFYYPFDLYSAELQKVLNLYEERYPEVKNGRPFKLVEPINLQHYNKKQGFKLLHNEDMPTRHRNLVFMTYLNDVEDGGTEFLYQKIKTKALTGLTLIWPSPWTHTHKGIISKTKEKYIVTGWYSYTDEVEIQKRYF